MTRVGSIVAALAMSLISMSSAKAEGMGRTHVKFGVEWGYIATAHMNHHYNYTDPVDGFRVDERISRFMLNSNGQANLSIGLEYLGHFSTGIHAGYSGIKQDTRVAPLQIRQSYFFNGYDSDGALAFAGGGLGINEKNGNISQMGQLGAGYRVVMSSRTSMDFTASLTAATDKPSVKDNESGLVIPSEYVNASDALLVGLNFSIALHF